MQTPTIGRARQTEAKRRKPPSGSSGTAQFAQLVCMMPSAPERTPEIAAAASLATILGAQEIAGDEGSRRSAASRYGIDLLDRLTELRMDVLEGRVSASRLAALGHALRADRRRCGEPRLDAVLDEIELRVEVEIAKLTRPSQAASPTDQDVEPLVFL
jgi:Class II flagellar assembly regulator